MRVPGIGRREFIQRAAALGAVSFIAPRRDEPFVIEDLEDQICARARTLRGTAKIQMRLLLPDGCQDNLAPIMESFAARTGVEMKSDVVEVDDINSEMILRTLTGEDAFDVALPATFGLPDLIEAGCLRNLDSFASQYEPAEYQADSLYTVGDYYKGSLYGYQTDGDTYLIFYNRRMLEDPAEIRRFEDTHGYAPRVAETWPELDAMMEHYHRPDQGQYGGTLFRTLGYIAWEWWVRFHAKGFFPFTDDLVPQVDNDAGVQALEELIKASRWQYPEASTNGLFANWDAFSRGDSFCNIGWGGTQKSIRRVGSKVRDDLAYGMTPGGVVEDALLRVPYFNWGWNYAVSAMSEQPEIAYLFCLYAGSPMPSTQAVRAAGGYFDPFRSAHYRDREIEETYSRAFLDVHEASMKESIPDLYLKGRGEYFSALQKYIFRADQGSMDPKSALQTVAQEWRHISDRMGVEGQREQWAFLKSRYPTTIGPRLR